MKNKTLAVLAITLSLALAAKAQVAQGGTYKLEQAVIAGGGASADATGNTYKLDGVIGEPVAGTTSTTAPFTVKGGFFSANALALAPTAATATVSGRVLTREGRGIRSVVITMIDGNGTIRTAVSTAFGYFNFAEVPSGETYIFTATAKRFTFSQPQQIYSVTEDVEGIIFVGAPNNE